MGDDLQKNQEGSVPDAAKLACVEADHVEVTPLHTRVELILESVDQLGTNDPDFDMKAFTDEMWGG